MLIEAPQYLHPFHPMTSTPSMKSTDSSLFKSAGHNRSPFKFRDGVHMGIGNPERAERLVEWMGSLTTCNSRK
jgi:hypothetical protein